MFSPTFTPWDLRTDSEQAIALEVLLHGPLARSELAQRLGLSPASLTRLVAPMIEGGLLEETGNPRRSSSNRPTRPLQVVGAAGHFVGVRLTPHEAHAVITNLRAEILGFASAEFDDTTPGGVVEAIKDLVASLRTTHHIEPLRLGVSLGGLVENHATVRSAPFFGWTAPIDLADALRRATGVPTVIDNDVMALTRAQSWFGLGRGLDRFALITLGIGIGLGVVMHGKLIESDDAGIGLAQHFPLDASGPLCPLGHQGCAQAMLSSEAIAARTSIALRRDVTYDEALDLVAAGQPAAVQVINQSARALGRLVAAVGNLTMCYRIIITGEGARIATTAADAMNRQLNADRDPAAAPIDFKSSQLGPADWAQGPAVLAIQTMVQTR